MDFNLRTADLRALNSMTKYPPIPTHHTLDKRDGGLLEEVVPFEGAVVGTEKVDGVNARIVLLPDGSYVIGSREELLYAQGDLMGNPALGIVEALRPVADRLPAVAPLRDAVIVYYLELYGGSGITPASRQYTGAKRVGWRLFDMIVVDDYANVMDWPIERIASWREHGGQRFYAEGALIEEAQAASLALTPRLFEMPASEIPGGIKGMHAFLREQLPATLVALDGLAMGKPEGIVLRSLDRSLIAKARFEDYDRMERRRNGGR